jgi:SAM-dependent methyltransferase
MRILDARCGSGRNFVYFLREGYEVYAVDPDVQAVESVGALARMFAPALPESNFSASRLRSNPFDALLVGTEVGVLVDKTPETMAAV